MPPKTRPTAATAAASGAVSAAAVSPIGLLLLSNCCAVEQLADWNALAWMPADLVAVMSVSDPNDAQTSLLREHAPRVAQSLLEVRLSRQSASAWCFVVSYFACAAPDAFHSTAMRDALVAASSHFADGTTPQV